VQELFRATAEVARLKGYSFHIEETHHTSKLDAPSGTALTLKQIVLDTQPGATVEITSKREGDHTGLHVVTARGENDLIELRHESFNRRGFAEGAVKAAEWLHGKSGAWEFREIFDQL